MKKIYLITFVVIVSFTILFAIQLNQWDNFQDNITDGWQVGSPSPIPPQVITSGGPQGVGDAYLLISSNGGSGAGGRLVVYNTDQWTGNYTDAGIDFISMYMNNFGTTDLKIRVSLSGPGGDCWSANPVSLPHRSGWVVAKFPVQAADLTGAGNISSTLRGVTGLRILHSVSGGYQGDVVTAQLGIDDITASEQPLPVEFISFSSFTEGNSVNLIWTTATETNNFGFEVQRKTKKDVEWISRGFIKGIGTSTEKHNYSFIEQNVPEGNYYYRLKQVDYSGVFSYSDVVKVKVNAEQFYLSQNYPNPFNPVTVIKYSLPQCGYVSLKVYNSIGKEIATLVNNVKETGTHEVKFDASFLSSGVYYYRLESGAFSQTNKMILMK